MITLRFDRPSTAPDALSEILDRQRQMDDLELAITEMVYRYRALFIGGNCLPFGVLSNGKRAEYQFETKCFLEEVQ